MNLNSAKLTDFNINPDYVNSLLANIPSSISEKFIRKINKENDRDNIISKLTELKFIKLFQDNNCSILDYEKPYLIENKKQTPDLTIKHQDCIFIAEVYRLGKSSIDSKIHYFINNITDSLEKINSNRVLEFKIDFDNIDFNSFNKDDLINCIQNWFSSEPFIGSFYNYKNTIEFRIICNHSKTKTYSFSSPVFLKIKNEKLIQYKDFEDNEITKKIKKYEALVNHLTTPFFIFIEADFLSGFHHSDFKERFHFTQTEIPDYEKHKDYWVNQGNGKVWTTLGDFYDFKFLSGLIIHCDDEFKLLLSPLKNQIIYQPKYTELLKNLKDNIAEL